MVSKEVMAERLTRDARQSLPPLSASDLELAAQAAYPSEALYQRASRWEFRDEFDNFISQPGSFRALTENGVNIAWLYKKLKVRPWQPAGSVLWHKAPPAQTEVSDARPCPDFGFKMPASASSPAGSSQLQPWDGKAAEASPRLHVCLPWEDADPTRPAWDQAAWDTWQGAAAPGSLAKTIVEAAAVAIAWADDVTPPTPPPPPPEGWVGICFDHYRPPPPPPILAADQGTQDFLIGSDQGDVSEGEEAMRWQ